MSEPRLHTEIEAKRAALMTARADVEDRLRQAKSDVQMFQRRLEELYFEIEALDSLSDEDRLDSGDAR